MNYFSNKKILIAGGTGLIGATISNKLYKLGGKVVSASIDSMERINQVLENPSLHKYIDLRNFSDCIEATKNCDIVINLMGVRESTQLGISKSATAFSAFLLCNTNLIESCCKNNIKDYLFCGSINEYPPFEIRQEDDLWKGLPSAQDRYVGLAKRIGEIQAEAYSKQFNWTAVKIVRPSNVYGPFDNFDPKTAHVIPSLIYKAIHSDDNKITVAGDGNAIRDFIYIDDLVDGILLTLEKADYNYPLNIGSGQGNSIKEVVSSILENLPNKNITIEWDISKPIGDKKRVLNVQRAKEHLCFSAKTSLSLGIKKTIDWYLNNEELAFKYGRTYDEKYE